MKSIILSVFFFSFLAFTLSSCEQDPCETVNCGQNGVCNDEGECVCFQGYLGENCEITPAEACNFVTCDAPRVCFEGNCLCPSGYMGANCDELIKTKLIGSYDADETCGGSNYPDYTVAITSGTLVNQIKIGNLNNLQCFLGGSSQDYAVTATVSETGITINSSACDADFVGGGSFDISGGVTTITLNYSVTYNPGSGTVTDNCVLTLTK